MVNIDVVVKEQDQRIEDLKQQNPAIAKWVEMLERGIMLSQDASEQLVTEVTDFPGKMA